MVLPAARSAAGDEPSDAKAILDRGIKALGGQDRLEKLKAATWKAQGSTKSLRLALLRTGSPRWPSSHRQGTAAVSGCGRLAVE